MGELVQSNVLIGKVLLLSESNPVHRLCKVSDLGPLVGEVLGSVLVHGLYLKTCGQDKREGGRGRVRYANIVHIA